MQQLQASGPNEASSSEMRTFLLQCHLQQRLLPLAAKALSEEGSGARGSEAVLAAERAAAVMLRAALLSAAARMGEPSLTLRVAEQILLPGRHATMPQFINVS